MSLKGTQRPLLASDVLTQTIEALDLALEATTPGICTPGASIIAAPRLAFGASGERGKRLALGPRGGHGVESPRMIAAGLHLLQC